MAGGRGLRRRLRDLRVFAWRDAREYAIPAEEVARSTASAGAPASSALAQQRISRHERDAIPRSSAPASRTGRDRPRRGRRSRALRVATGHGEGGPASKRVIVGYGFWIFLLCDIVMFSAFFAAYAVLADGTAGGPTGRELFDFPTRRDPDRVPAPVELHLRPVGASRPSARNQRGRSSALLVTGLLGLGVPRARSARVRRHGRQGAGPDRSAFLSSFFALVGLHGLHVTAGLLWLGTMMAQVFVKGFRPDILRRLVCFSLFWHALDIIWVALFTVVYLIGSRPMTITDSARTRRPRATPRPATFIGAVGEPLARALRSYVIGLVLAARSPPPPSTCSTTSLIWEPGIPVALIVLAIAQMGVHLVFFLHITTAPDNTNNVLALAFGVLIVVLVIGGSLWIMDHLNHNMMPMDQMMQMQR